MRDRHFVINVQHPDDKDETLIAHVAYTPATGEPLIGPEVSYSLEYSNGDGEVSQDVADAMYDTILELADANYQAYYGWETDRGGM